MMLDVCHWSLRVLLVLSCIDVYCLLDVADRLWFMCWWLSVVEWLLFIFGRWLVVMEWWRRPGSHWLSVVGDW